MKTLQQAVERVSAQVREHCRARGYTQGPWLNPLVPVDCISAWAMARYLAGAGEIDHYLAVAPEGHVYGFCFEKLGVRVHSVFVDYVSKTMLHSVAYNQWLRWLANTKPIARHWLAGDNCGGLGHFDIQEQAYGTP